MIIDFKREETKLRQSLKEMKDKNIEDDKDMKERIKELENKIKQE